MIVRHGKEVCQGKKSEIPRKKNETQRKLFSFDRVHEEAEPGRLDYSTGLPMQEAVRQNNLKIKLQGFTLTIFTRILSLSNQHVFESIQEVLRLPCHYICKRDGIFPAPDQEEFLDTAVREGHAEKLF